MRTLIFATLILISWNSYGDTETKNFLIFRWNQERVNDPPQYAFSNQEIDFRKPNISADIEHLEWHSKGGERFFLANGKSSFKYHEGQSGNDLELSLVGGGPPFHRHYAPMHGYPRPIPPPFAPPPVYFYPPGYYNNYYGPRIYAYPPTPPAIPFYPYGYGAGGPYIYFGFRGY